MDNIPIAGHPDPEIHEFEEALLLSVDQMKRGEFGRVHTPRDIATYKMFTKQAADCRAKP
jgi:hypothetical protein